MGIWHDILQCGFRRDMERARELLYHQLPLSLREYSASPRGERVYRGVLPTAVGRFFASLPEHERSLASSVRCDFVDYLLEDVCDEVARTLWLIDFCCGQDSPTIDWTLAKFPWAKGLKRNDEWKKQRIATYLRSFSKIGITLPPTILKDLDDEEEACFDFNEIAFAVAPKRLELSWQGFKDEYELSEDFLRIVTDEDEISSVAEVVDFSRFTGTALWINSTAEDDLMFQLDLQRIGKKISAELNEIMEHLHQANKREGYCPIAWHNVFWRVSSDYEGLSLELKLLDPLRETDQELASYLATNYPEVKSTSRPVVSRRRKKLLDDCTDHLIHRLQEELQI